MIEQLRPGRFGPIYRGRDDTTGLEVAIKIIDQPLEAEQAEVLAGALGRLADAPLQHPSIVPVLTAGAAASRVWMVEPWFGAPALDGLMRRHGPQPIDDVLVRVTQLAAALDFAAAADLHHGALHPRDILVTDDRIVVSGVGVLEAFAEAGLAVPMTGAYVSPQRREGLPPSPSDDVFALAWIVYELVCGTTLPIGSDLRTAMPAVPGVDRAAFAVVLDRALSPDVDERPSSSLAFAELLQGVMIQAPEEPEPAAEFTPEPTTTLWEADARDDDIPIRQHERPMEMPPPVAAPTAPAPPAAAADLPLRASEPVHEAVIRERTPMRPARTPAPPPSSEYGYWFPVSATLAIGLLMGFASGYVVGQRQGIPAPYSSERPLARDNRAVSPEVPPASGAAPAPSGGRAYTDSVVAPEGSSGQPSVPSSEAPAQAAAPQSPPQAEPQLAERPQPSGPGVLQVESRPRGARVFIDGRLVGTTPVIVNDVQPGTHAVRIDLAGHRRWVTTIELAPGERHRVAASLER